MDAAHWLTAGEQFPPPGRTRLSFDEAKDMLVEHSAFQASSTRRQIWDNLERYLANFFRIEEALNEELEGADLIHYLWLGGSFVSSKLDPNNLDLSVIVDGVARAKVKGREGSGWLTDAFARAQILREYRLSPLEVGYRPVASPFNSRLAEPLDQDYLRERGAWDDWWQRCRSTTVTDGGPTIETCKTVRGYLEVTL